MRRHVKLGGMPSSGAGDIIRFSKFKMAAQSAILDLVQRLKLIGNIYLASMRRPAKFGRNRSSRSGDIKDFSKSKMAAVPPFGSSSKIKAHREHICSLNATTCKIW